MEVITSTLVYKNDELELKVLFHQQEAILIKGDMIQHFWLCDLQNWVTMGLLLDDIESPTIRKKIQDELLELHFNSELEAKKNKLLNKHEKNTN